MSRVPFQSRLRRFAFRLGLLAGVGWCGAAFAVPRVQDLVVTPIPPWGVALDYTITGATSAEAVWQPEISVTVEGVRHDAQSLTGETTLVNGAHRIYWNLAQDGISATNAAATFRISFLQPNYYVIDLSGGQTAPETTETDTTETDTTDTDTTDTDAEETPPSVEEDDADEEETTADDGEAADGDASDATNETTTASSFTVDYLVDEPDGGFNVDDYKTTKLVLKRLPAGTYKMGGTSGRAVTLTQPFALGLFELTQKQWELVMGTKPSLFPTNTTLSGDTLPVECISYNDLRGATAGKEWPTSTDVDATSFLGRLRQGVEDGSGASIPFDLPTEAQWEYACRAGTTTTYSWGNAIDREAMWYLASSSQMSHRVGRLSPNPWGFYDMHGNVWEWCRDWHGTLPYGEDPVGAKKNVARPTRVVRGGSWKAEARLCTSSNRGSDLPTYTNETCGARLSLTLTTDLVGGLEITNVAVTAETVLTTLATGSAVEGALAFGYLPCVGTNAVVTVDGEMFVSSPEAGAYTWQPKTTGTHTLVHTNGEATLSANYAVTRVEVSTWTPPVPNPPMAEVADIAADPTNSPLLLAEGDFNYIVTSGTGVWTAAASDDWISFLPQGSGVMTNGVAGEDHLVYLVEANGEAEERTGYVYVSGHVCTLTQEGQGAEVTPQIVEVERTGGVATVDVATPQETTTWRVSVTNEWLALEAPTGGCGVGSGQVSFRLAPLFELSSRTSLVTIAGQEITVIQYGTRFLLETNAVTVGDLGTNDMVQLWSSPGIPWTAVSDATNWLTVATNAGVGGAAIAWTAVPQTTLKTRTGTVTFTPDSTEEGISTKTFTVTQEPAVATLSATNCSATREGMRVDVGVALREGVEWEVGSVPDWVTVLSPTGTVTQPGTAQLLIATNELVTPRTGVATIAEQAFTIEQEGVEVDLTSAERVYGVNGVLKETWAVDVPVGADWVATCDAGWVYLRPTSGTGPATLNYLVMQYGRSTARIPRTCTITVSNATQQVLQTLTILQTPEVLIDDDGKLFVIKDAWFEANPGLGGSGVAAWQTIAEGNGVKTDAAGKALPVWHDYVAGTDPTNALSRLVAHIALSPTNLLPLVTWTPALNGEGVREGVRVYRVWGKASLDDDAWVEVPAGDEALYRFFYVTVEMP